MKQLYLQENKIAKQIILIFSFFFCFTTSYAQLSNGGKPASLDMSLRKSGQLVSSVTLQSINPEQLKAEDFSYGTPFRYGVVQDVAIDIKQGTETPAHNGTLWRYEISSAEAKSLKLVFSTFDIPQGANLFIYSPDYSLIYGAFTEENASDDGSFVIADFPSSTLIIEYFEPFSPQFSGVVILEKVGLAYRDLNEMIEQNSLGEEFIDVNCGEGIKWQLEKHAVFLFTFIEDRNSYLCTGALINNVNNDGTPYALTANHCISSPIVAKTLTAYLNHETEGCGLMAKTRNTLNGATLVATGANSDFSLLRLESVPPANFQPYYAGWNLEENATRGTGIHQPNGILKKISLSYNQPTTFLDDIYWDEGGYSPASTHWEIFFDKGATAGGSSGSPLFDQNGLIIGQLHGGGDYDSYYGKLNYSWTKGNAIASQTTISTLKQLLANGSDITSHKGYVPATNLPEAIFTPEFQQVCTGEPIKLKDYSLFNITQWKWEITPSTITYHNGTSSTSANPEISFDNEGYYTIELTVENSEGKDSMIRQNAVIASSSIDVSFEQNFSSGKCLYELDTLKLFAYGATNYSWQIASETSSLFNTSNIDNNTFAIIKNDTIVIESTVTIKGTLIGTHGTCVDTAFFSIDFLKPENDNLINAQFIEPGQNGPFCNTCATVEDNEPIPPFESCTTQTDWCDEYGTGKNIVENSVWFYFDAPESGKVSIEATGMDGQIALYEANSERDILNGNYTILAANDDKSSLDPESGIDTVAVIPGKRYWIQFDGSGGGTEGEFLIILKVENKNWEETKIHYSETEKPARIFPQPADDRIIIQDDSFNKTRNIGVKIFSLTGSLLLDQQVEGGKSAISVNLKPGWPSGVYLISLTTNDKSYSQKIVISR